MEWRKRVGEGKTSTEVFFFAVFFFWFSSELMCNVSFKDFIYSDKQVRNVLWNHQKAPQTEGGVCVGVLQSLNVYITKIEGHVLLVSSRSSQVRKQKMTTNHMMTFHLHMFISAADLRNIHCFIQNIEYFTHRHTKSKIPHKISLVNLAGLATCKC